MRPEHLELLACPSCAGALDEDGSRLLCGGCGASYPVRDGIPRFVDEGYTSSFGLQWNRFRGEQLDSHNGTSISEARFFAETGWSPEWLAERQVVDIGCGAGRFLEVASRHARLAVGVDASSAVDAAAVGLGSHENVLLVQASVFALPFRAGVFDGCYCIGVLQHTPDPQRAALALARVVRPGGRVCVTAYERKPWTRLNGKYLLRPLTKRLPPSVLLRAIQALMPLLFAVSEVLFRIPAAGRVARFVLPVANYTGERRLSLRQRYRWAVLDTFDALSPDYDSPMTAPEVLDALRRGGVRDLERRPNPGVNVVGTIAGG